MKPVMVVVVVLSIFRGIPKTRIFVLDDVGVYDGEMVTIRLAQSQSGQCIVLSDGHPMEPKNRVFLPP